LRSALVVGVLVAGLVGCSGDDGAQGAAGPAGVPVVSITTATALNIAITNVTVASPPVVTFRLTNEAGLAVVGLKLADVRFTMAKLVPGSGGNPSAWQSYINSQATGAAGTPGAGTTAIQATTEGSGAFTGTFTDNGDGTYTYAFKTDIANVTSPLAVSYDPTLTHRLGIHTRGSAPITNAVYTFRPSDGATTGLFGREIVKTAKCNECHNKLALHGGSRTETQLCVTCHNPGSTDPDSTNTVNFTQMVHKIHMGEELPSVRGPDGILGTVDDGTYQIIGFGGSVHDFSTVVFPMGSPGNTVGELRHCTKCHDGADPATPQGDNWKTQPSMAACGACHDNVNFADGTNHSGTLGTGGVQTDNSQCLTCHSAGGLAGSIESSHEFPAKAKAEGAKYQFNILSVTNTAPGESPVITFSITDPTSANAKYNLKTDTRLTAGSISVAVGWNNADENNTGSTSNPGLPLNIGLTGSSAANAADNGDNTYTVNLATVTLPNGVTNRVIPVGTTGSGRVALYGRAAVELNSKTAGAERVHIKAAFKDFAITDTTPVTRRKVVDIAKCDKCHDQLSLHGDSRTDEPGVCVMCHNPSGTDVNRRPKIAAGLPGAGFPNAAVTLDGKTEEAIDFKRMIHGIHAGAQKDYTGAEAHGIREKGLVVYGFSGNPTDFSHVRFPGILNDCNTCHVTTTVDDTTYGTYELVGKWEIPTASGILGSTIMTAPDPTGVAGTFAQQLANQADDLNITPTAAVCTACHDSVVAQSHMQLNGALFGVIQATINTGATLEACAICHGPGRVADVKVMHGVK
jgi:OmcA/MtrC family decaheme c-type cytochrome